MENEIWRDIKGYEYLYQVSNLGRVKSVSRKVSRGNSFYTVKEKILNYGVDRLGYTRVVLSNKCNCRTFLVHRLVAEAFIPNPNNLPYINHKDENPSNNCIDNLEWCTQKYNVNYGTTQQRHSITNGKSINQYDLQGNFINNWQSASHASRALGINRSNIWRCCNGYTKKMNYKGYKWEYAEK